MADTGYYDPYQAASMSAAADAEEEMEEEEYEDDGKKKGNVLPVWGNTRTMNMNPLILTNIQNSPYFKVNLFEIKVSCMKWYSVRFCFYF